MTDWKPDPTKGGEHIEPRKQEVLKDLRSAADVAYYHIEEQLEKDIEDLKKKAGEQKSKIVSSIKKIEALPALTVVRKYWQKDSDGILHHLTETIMRDGD